MRTALLFPGQASQYVGMGADLHAAHAMAREMYETARRVLGYDLAELSFRGPAERLVQTIHTQPAIYVHSCIMHRLASEQGLTFEFAAGHSLGEYSALVAAGVLTYEDGLLAVAKRAQFMQEACDAHPGTMAAILGLGYEAVQSACASASKGGEIVVAANFNAEKQIAISGSLAGIDVASALAREAGAKRVIPLAVGGAFHSPLMHPAPERLAPVLDTLTFRPAQRPVVLNVTADPTTDPGTIKSCLLNQLIQPVLWFPTMQRLQREQTTRLIEVGPKKVLLGLAKTVLDGAEALSLDTVADLAAWAGVESTAGKPS
ncbi:MAG: ACP S-malonyltransferase [Candidatus Zixiibacteriota bacterium]